MTFPAPRVRTLDWTLRVGAAMCFIGHGAFGVMTKPAWVPYFAVVGMSPAAAFAWMPVIGGVDILMGCLVLFTPRPAVAAWMVAWATWTALLRPPAEEPIAEALERAGNYGVPLALFIALWKIATEALFVTAWAPAWEWIERGGSYAAPVALALVIRAGALLRSRARPSAPR